MKTISQKENQTEYFISIFFGEENHKIGNINATLNSLKMAKICLIKTPNYILCAFQMNFDKPVLTGLFDRRPIGEIIKLDISGQSCLESNPGQVSMTAVLNTLKSSYND